MSFMYLTSDLHLGHRSVHKYRTQFSSAEEHHEAVFDNTASAVNKRDTLWLLGDVAFDRYWLERIKGIRCHKVLVCGNHDRDRNITMKDLCEVYDKIYALQSHRNMWFTHCPIHPQEIRGREAVIHGHLHDKLIPDDRYINVCLEHTDFRPVKFCDILELRDKQIQMKLEV